MRATTQKPRAAILSHGRPRAKATRPFCVAARGRPVAAWFINDSAHVVPDRPRDTLFKLKTLVFSGLCNYRHLGTSGKNKCARHVAAWLLAFGGLE